MSDDSPFPVDPGCWSAPGMRMLVAQVSQPVLDAAQIAEMERLKNGGKRPDHSVDFMLCVVTPLAILVTLIALCRHLIS